MLCLDGHLQNIEYHQQRVDETFGKLFPANLVISLADSISVPTAKSSGAFRARLVYHRDVVSIDFLPIVLRSFKSFVLITDNAIVYDCKYEDRSALNRITELKKDADEVIIVQNGYITDTTIGNLLFFDGTHWHTPSNPLLKGTMRQLLIDKGLCYEKQITADNLSRYKSVLMVNALLGFEPQNAVPISAISNLHNFGHHCTGK